MSTTTSISDTADYAIRELGNSVALIVAKRIATLALTDAAAAKADYQQSVAGMTASEVETFNRYVAQYAMAVQS